MKKAIALVLAVAAMLMCMAGCDRETEQVPTDTLRQENGVLCWDAVEDASYYEVDLGSGATQVQQNAYSIVDECEYVGEFSALVTAVTTEGGRSIVGTMDISVQMLSKPVISVQEKDGKLYFTWEAVEGASGHSYHAYDGAAMQTAQADSNGVFWVEITDTFEQLIQVTAHGSSSGNQVLLTSQDYFQYSTDRVFDMTKLAQYRCVYTAGGATLEMFEFGTTLTQGVWDLELTMYVMDSKGRSVQGNGGWGRRIFDKKNRLFWFCETPPSDSWPDAANTIPASDEAIKRTIAIDVNRHGNAYIPFYEFNKNEMVVIVDAKFQGKSILNKAGGVPNVEPEVEKLDVDKAVKNAIAVYQADGHYYNEPGIDNKIFNLTLKTNLPDGQHIVDISYYLCKTDGGPVYDNGQWGRRIVDHNRIEKGPYFWLNEWDIGGTFPAQKIPLPTEKANMRHTVDVKNGKFTLTFLDFSKDEMFIINSIKAVEIPKENGVFVSKGLWEEQFDVTTTLTGVPRYVNVSLEVTCRISDLEGNSLKGKGQWGRRIVPDSKTPIWLTDAAVEDYPESYDTLPTADELYTFNPFVTEVTRHGVVTLNMHDFNVGEMVEIISIRHEGELVMGTEVPEKEQVTAYLGGFAGWGDRFIPFTLTQETKDQLDGTSWFSTKDTSGYDKWTKLSGTILVDGKSRKADITVTSTYELIIGDLPGWQEKTMTITLPKDNVYTLYQVGNGGGTLKNGGTLRFGHTYEIQVNKGKVKVVFEADPKEKITAQLTDYQNWSTDNEIPFFVSDSTKVALEGTSWFKMGAGSGSALWAKAIGKVLVDGKEQELTIIIANDGGFWISVSKWKTKNITIVLPKETVFTLSRASSGGTLKNGGEIRFAASYEIQVKDGVVTLTEK